MIRLFDIVFSLFGLFFLVPLFLITIVILRFTGEGEVFYKQQRIGKQRGQFHIYKFATMLKESPHIGSGELTEFNDPRVLPAGRILRKTKINELPQLYNVLKGDMSLVGPRPQTSKFFSLFSSRSQKAISSVRPGVTGISSLIFRDEEAMFRWADDPVHFDDTILTPYKGLLEEWFVANQSVSLYFKIILLTVISVFRPGQSLPTGYFKALPEPPAELLALMKKSDR